MAPGKAARRASTPRSEDRSNPRRSNVACNRCRNRKTRCAGNPPYPCAACKDANQVCVYSEAEKRVSIPESPFPSVEVPVERDDWWYKGTDHLFLNRSGEHHFVGPSSATHLAKRLNPTSGNLAWDIRPLYNDPTSLRQSVSRALPQMPPFEFAKRLFWVHYTYIGTIFSLIQPRDFEERLHVVYNQPPDFSNRESCLIGLALRMAISLGLHQEVSDPTISEDVRNRRRRAWWSVYSLDRLLSVKSGNPITIQDEDIGTTWPVPTPGSSDIPWPSVVLTHYTQLSRILGRIGEEIYRKKPRTGTNLLASAQSITTDLSEWLQRVPDGLRIDFSTLDTHINRESVSTFLHFYSCINMTARPLVFYVIQRRLEAESRGSATDDWKEGLSQSTVAVIDSCITAARATTIIMDAAAKHNLVATYGYLDGEYAFSAALILVMVNAVFPHNDANARTMEMALNLLRSMADRGNTYLGARHALLLELQSAIGPSGSRKSGNTMEAPVTPSSTIQQSTPATNTFEEPAPVLSTEWPLPQDLPSMRDMTLNFDINDDPGLWEEVLGQIDIDMDTDWIENTLRR
ncbi:hypothetical protein ATERTT37_001294 [Aspergillus terreus]